MTDREFLREAISVLRGGPDGIVREEQFALAKRIEDHLVTPDMVNTDTLWLVEKIRKEPFDEYADLVPHGTNEYALTYAEAAAIEGGRE